MECLSDAHCTPNDPDANDDASFNTAKCNKSGTNRVTTNFPENTCIDSVKPTITPEAENFFSPSASFKSFDSTYWLKSGIYEIDVSDTDNVGGSGIDTSSCSYTVRDAGLDTIFGNTDDSTYSSARTCGGKTYVYVNDGVWDDCMTQGQATCRLEAYAQDLAGNLQATFKVLNIDYTAPSGQ